MKVSIIVIFCLVISFSSCITKKENQYLNTGLDFGFKKPKKTVGCYYVNFEYRVMDTIISKIGEGYKIKLLELSKICTWNNIIVKEISKKPIDITIWQFIAYEAESETEMISIKIEKKGKDFLNYLKFRNRMKTKKFLNNISEKK